MIRNFLHSAFSYKRPYEHTLRDSDLLIYYDDTEARESFDQTYTNEIVFTGPFLRMMHMLNSRESYLPTDEIIVYSDSLTTEAFAAYITDLTKERDRFFADTTTQHRAFFPKDVAAWCTQLTALLPQVRFRPHSECAEVEILKRLHKLEHAYKNLDVTGTKYPNFFIGGTRRMYNIILAEN